MKTPTELSSFSIVGNEIVQYNSNVATVSISADVGYDEDLVFVGEARRHPDDKHNVDVAINVARARAYRKLSDTLERRAAGLVKHADDVREDRKIRRKISLRNPIQTVRQVAASSSS